MVTNENILLFFWGATTKHIDSQKMLKFEHTIIEDTKI